MLTCTNVLFDNDLMHKPKWFGSGQDNSYISAGIPSCRWACWRGLWWRLFARPIRRHSHPPTTQEPYPELIISIYPFLHKSHRRRINTEEKAKVVAAAWWTELIQLLAVLAILHQADLKKRISRIIGGMDAFKKWMIIWFTPHQTTTLQKWMIWQIILAANCLVRNLSTTTPNQQQQPLPFLLYVSFFCD